MIWLTWRQFRTQTLVALLTLAAAAIFIAITHAQLVHLYNASGIPTCQADGDCFPARNEFLNHDQLLRTLLGLALLAVPAIIGIFWGAPLVSREIETGTFRLAWTQSVTRGRWLAAKLIILGLASMATAGLFSWLVTWWFGRIDGVKLDRLNPGVFDERGIVAVGYGAFAFALGVTTGALFRRTVPAMATTLVVFIGTRLVFTQWVRPHLIGPAHLRFPLNTSSVSGLASHNGGSPKLIVNPPQLEGAWYYSTSIVDKAGHTLTPDFLVQACSSLMNDLGPGLPGLGKGPTGTGSASPSSGKAQAFQDCVAKVGEVYHGIATYQPADRYWLFQGIETAIFIGLAVVLAGFCFWWIRRGLG